jgi:hypothetical protein
MSMEIRTSLVYLLNSLHMTAEELKEAYHNAALLDEIQ